jgi:pyrroloquinoline quinone (PQQ) biosynthesis protein C
MNKPEDIEFFTVHEQADIYHSRDEMNALLEQCKTEEDQNNAIDAIKKSTALYWQMLDAYN